MWIILILDEVLFWGKHQQFCVCVNKISSHLLLERTLPVYNVNKCQVHNNLAFAWPSKSFWKKRAYDSQKYKTRFKKIRTTLLYWKLTCEITSFHNILFSIQCKGKHFYIKICWLMNSHTSSLFKDVLRQKQCGAINLNSVFLLTERIGDKNSRILPTNAF